MKNFPYDLNVLKNYIEIENKSLNFFDLKKKRFTWDYLISKLVKLKFENKLAEEFFSVISLELYHKFPSIISSIIDYENYKNLNLKLIFSNEIINNIISINPDKKIFFKNFKKKYNYNTVSKTKIFLRNLYFSGYINKEKIDLIDHNYNSLRFLKKKFYVKYKPSNNFFDFKKITNNKCKASEDFKEIFSENFKFLKIIFYDYLNKNFVSKEISDNFLFFLKCYLEFEINLYLQVRKILKNLNFSSTISSSISGFKPSRVITSYNYYSGNKILKFDDNNGGLIHGNHKAAYLNNLINSTDYYFATTSGKNNSEKLFKEFFKENKINKKINFHSLNYEKNFQLKKKKLINKNLKYVYFSMSFLNYATHGSGSFHDLDYLKIQNVIFEFLKLNTTNLIYRAHPETLIGIKKNPLEKYINTLSFKETIKNGNICIFDSTISSAFWECLLNRNPLILIRHYHVDEKSFYLKRLEKRCVIIDITEPEQTRDILQNLNFKIISDESIEKSQSNFDNFDLFI